MEWARFAMAHGFKWLGVVLAAAIPVHSLGAERDAPGPNIVFILADDLGYGDLGCYNPDSKVPTPHLDRLAGQGMRFTDAHSPSSVCSPTRYALLTGRYAWRSALKRGVLVPWDPPLIEPGRLTVASFLAAQGYETSCIGKWHLGWEWVTKDGRRPASGTDRLSNVDFTKAIGQGPTTRGFHHYFGTDVPNYPPYCFIADDRTLGIPSVPNRPEFNRPGPMLPGWQWVDIMPELTRRAVAFIETAATAEGRRPFFLYMPLTAPHYPVVPSEDFLGKSRAGDHGDFVVQVDHTVGEVLAALDGAGVADNTLVFFTSDNGPEIVGEVKPGAYERLRQYGHASMGPLRGVKRDLWEGGHRVPFLARWPGRIKPASVSDETICHVDLLATVAAIVGAKLPDDAAEDSHDLLPALLGTSRDRPIRESTVHHSASGRFALRQGDWVVIDAPSGGDNGRAPNHGEPDWFQKQRGYTSHAPGPELFNLRADPAQRENLFASEPDRAHAMREELTRIQSSSGTRPGRPVRD